VSEEPEIAIGVESGIEEQLAAFHTVGGWYSCAPMLAYLFAWELPDVGVVDGHVHSGMELSVVLTGEIDIHFAETSMKCGPGDVWMCSMWEPHAWRINTAGTTNISLIFPPELLADRYSDDPPFLELFALPPEDRPRPTEADLRERLLATGKDTYREMWDGDVYWRTTVRLSLLRILTELSRLRGESMLRRRSRPAAGHYSYLGQIMPAVRLITQQPGQRVTATEVAAACSLSRSRFHRVFRTAMGTNFREFSARVRLAFVAHRLLHSTATIEAIAKESGFVDASHLCRAFAKHYGRTPTQYRRMTRRIRPS